jgi:hypothetical protein
LPATLRILSRNDPQNQLTETWVAQSVDGGESFTNFRVSDVAFTPYPIPQTAIGYMGDYIGIASKIGKAYATWMDNRTGRYQGYIDIIDTYQSDQLTLAYQSRSINANSTAYGTVRRLVWDGTKLNRLFRADNFLAYSNSTDDGSTWIGTQFINASQMLDANSNPSLASYDGKLHTVFESGANIYYNRTASPAWLTPWLLLADGAVSGISSAIDATGIGRVAYVRSNIVAGGSTEYSVRYGTFNTSDANPVLTGITVLATSTTSGYTFPAVGVDANNQPHVLYQQNSEIYHRYKGTGGWTPAFNVSNTSTASSAPSIYVQTSDNSAHVVWQELITSSNNEIYYRSRSSSGSWSSSQNLSNNPTHSIDPFISGPVSSGPLVVWADASAGTYDIKYYFPIDGLGGSFKTTPAASRYPNFTLRNHTNPVRTRAYALWTDSDVSPYNIEDDYKDFAPFFGKVIAQEGEDIGTPSRITLAQNYPNPFNPTTSIAFTLPREAYVTLKIYDVLGREVETPMESKKEAGTHTVNFHANTLGAGIYFYTLSSEGSFETRKMILLR